MENLNRNSKPHLRGEYEDIFKATETDLLTNEGVVAYSNSSGMTNIFTIRNARKDDAPFIAQIVMTAVGEDICNRMAGSPERLPLIEQLFTDLASDEQSQYSYRNTIIVCDKEGNPAGGVVSYNGKDLQSLRKAFIKRANQLLGWNISENDFDDETSADEYYLDSLMVVKEHRREGLGSLLIEEAQKRARLAGKPLGLLVDHDNPRARRLYDETGFIKVGERPFAGVMMEHMQRN